MNLCRYDTSKPCDNHGTSSRTCLDCVLGKIRADVINIADDKRSISVRSVIKIIDKYKAESEK